MPPADDLAVRYLLGELPEAEREALEEQYFGEEGAFEDLKAAEDDLIDAYCRGTLPAEHRLSFEARYLETESGRERLEFARALKDATRRRLAARPPRLLAGWGTWAAAIGAMALGSGLLLFLAQLHGERRQARAENEALQRSAAEQDRQVTQLTAERERLRAEISGLEKALAADSLGRIASLVLATGLQRDLAIVPRLVLEPGTEIARVTLRLKTDPYPSYEAAVETVEGRELWKRDGLRTIAVEGGRALVLHLPASLLTSQHCVVVVRGRNQPPSEQHAEYVFQVQRRGR